MVNTKVVGWSTWVGKGETFDGQLVIPYLGPVTRGHQRWFEVRISKRPVCAPPAQHIVFAVEYILFDMGGVASPVRKNFLLSELPLNFRHSWDPQTFSTVSTWVELVAPLAAMLNYKLGEAPFSVFWNKELSEILVAPSAYFFHLSFKAKEELKKLI